MKIKRVILLISSFLLIGCSSPDEHSVIKDFITEYPNRVVVSAIPGEGDFENIYYRITYKISGKDNTNCEAWLYQKKQKGKWVVSTKKLPCKQ